MAPSGPEPAENSEVLDVRHLSSVVWQAGRFFFSPIWFLDGFWMFVGLCCFYLRLGADTWQNTSTQLILPKFPSLFFQRPQRWDCGKNISFNMNQLSGLRLLSVAWAIWEEELLCARRLCLWRPWDGSKVFGHSWALRNHRYHRSRAAPRELGTS